jgi:hypothetical protein
MRAGRISNICPTAQISSDRVRSEVRHVFSGNAVALVSDYSSRTIRPDETACSQRMREIVIQDDTGKALAIDRLKVGGQAFRDSCPGISGRGGGR